MKKAMYGYPLSLFLFQFIFLITLALLTLFIIIYHQINGLVLYTLIGIFLIASYLILIDKHKRFLSKRNQILRLMIDAARPTGSEHVLDLGTGAGYVALGISKELDNGHVYGIDKYNQKTKGIRSYLSDQVKINYLGNTMKNAQANATIEQQQQSTTFLQADLTKPIPFRSETFDVIVSSQFFYCILAQELPFVLQEVHRVLKPGGRLVFFESKQFLEWNIEKVNQYFTVHGYETQMIESMIFPKKCIFVGKKPVSRTTS